MRTLALKHRYPTALRSFTLLLAVAACGSAPAPVITSTSPADNATDVPLNAKLSVNFDTPMSALTATTFTLTQGTQTVAGTVATAVGGKSATFAPSGGLAASSLFTATITTGALSVEGAPLAMRRSWKFTTGTAPGTTAPVVTATAPAADAIDIAINTYVTATFSEALDPLTVTGATFTVKQGGINVPGAVVYGPGAMASFKSAGALAINTLFTASLSIGIRDLQGNALVTDRSWSFTTGTRSAIGPARVDLGAAGNFAVLAKSAISTVPASVITGDVGLGPAAASYLTGFSLVADATNVFSVSPQIVGKAFAANYAVPTPANLTVAVANMETAYTDAAGRPTPDHLELGSGNLGGLTLNPGLYKWTSSLTIPADLTLAGGANDTWIFQTSGDVSIDAAKQVVLSGGALAKNVFWQVAGRVTLGAASHFEGVVLCKTEVTLQTGATMNGRILAQTQVALQQATVTQPL